MTFQRQSPGAGAGAGGNRGDASSAAAGSPGKRSLTEAVGPIQAKPAAAPASAGAKAGADGGASASPGESAAVQGVAARGAATPSTQLPHADTIQRAFGRHDISGIQAHMGDEAAASADEMGAAAYATNNHVVLGPQADLFTVAHEAAHVVQQTGGVQLAGGVGVEGDAHEQHADAVAHAVVAGQSAEPLLDKYAGRGGGGAGDAASATATGAAGGAVQRKPVADPKRSAPFYQDDKHPDLKLKELRKTGEGTDFQIRNMLQPLYWKAATEDAYYTDQARTQAFDIADFEKTHRFGGWLESFKETHAAHAEIDGQGLDPKEAERRKNAISMYLLQQYITNALYRANELELLEYQASPLNFQENSQYLRSFATSYVKALQATIGPDFKPNKLYLTRDASFRDVLDKFFEVARCEAVMPDAVTLQGQLALTIEKSAEFLLASDKDLNTYWERDGNPQAFVDVTPALATVAANAQHGKVEELGAFVKRAFAQGVAKQLAQQHSQAKGKNDDFRDEVSAKLEEHVDAVADTEKTRGEWDGAARGTGKQPLKGNAKQEALAAKVMADAVELPKLVAWVRARAQPGGPPPAVTKPHRTFLREMDAGNTEAAKTALKSFIANEYTLFLDSKLDHAKESDFAEPGAWDAYQALRPRVERAFASSNMAVVTGGMVSLPGPTGYAQSAVMVDDPAMQMAVKTAINKSGSVPTPTDSTRKLLGHQSLAEIVNGVIAQQSEGKKSLQPQFEAVKAKLTSFDPKTYTSIVQVHGQLAATRTALEQLKAAFAANTEQTSLEARAAIKLIEGSGALEDDTALPAFVLKQLEQHMMDAVANQARIEDHVRSIQGIHEAVILALELDAKPHDEAFKYGAPQHDTGGGKDAFFRGAHITDYGLKAFSQAYDAAAAQVKANGQGRLDLEAFYNIYFELSDKLSATRNATKGGKVALENPSSVGDYLASARFKSLDAKAQGVDVIMVDIHPNDATKKKIVSNEVSTLIAEVLDKKKAEDDFRLTVMIDITLNHPGEEEVKAIREAAQPFIASGKLNLVFVESLAKFSQMGMDKHSGGLVFAYNDGTSWQAFNESLEQAKARDTVDPTIHKYFQALFQHAETEQKEYLERVRANTKRVHQMLKATFARLKIAEDAIQIAENVDDGSCYVALRYDEFTAKVYPVQQLDNFDEMHHFNEDILEKGINAILRQTGLPVAMRFSFGFPVSNLGETGKEVRFTIGLEGAEQLQRYVDVLAYVNGSLATRYEAQQGGHTGYPELADRGSRATILQEITAPIKSLADLELKLKDLLKKD